MSARHGTRPNIVIPDEIHRALKVLAAQQGVTMRELILQILTVAVRKTE